MAKYTINDTTLTSIADAIRAKGGTSAALTPSQMAEAIAAIQAGGGGGAEILGHKVAYGSFTLTEDTTTKYTVLDKTQVLEAIKDDFPGLESVIEYVYTEDGLHTLKASFFLIAVCWRDISDDFYNAKTGTKAWIAAIMPVNSSGSSNSALAYGDNYGTFGARSGSSNGLQFDTYGNMTIGFGASYAGYAGTKYNWLIFPMDHGAVKAV